MKVSRPFNCNDTRIQASQINKDEMHSQGESPEIDLRKTINYVREEREGQPFTSNNTMIELEGDANESVSRRKEEIAMVYQRIYSPILRCMKLFGLYYGDTSMKKFREVAPLQRNRTISISMVYCIVAAISLWFNVVMALASLSVKANSKPVLTFILITNLLWGLQTAIGAVACLTVLPLRDGKTSRFEKFLRSLMESNIDLGKLKSISLKMLIIAGAVWMMSLTTNIFTSLRVKEAFVRNYPPWDDMWYGFTIVNILTILIYLHGAWLLPISFICVTATLLGDLIDNFSEKVFSNNVETCQLDLGALREEHQKLCNTTELASKMLSPLFLVIVAGHIPMTCFCFYISINRPQTMDGNITELYYVTGSLYWLLLSALTVAVVLVFGSRVNGKVSGKLPLSESFLY